MKTVQIYSSYSTNLRAQAVKDVLDSRGVSTTEVQFYQNQGSPWELILNIIPNSLYALFSQPDMALGFKPYPSALIPLIILQIKKVPVCIDVDDLDHGYRGGIISAITLWVQKILVKQIKRVSYHNDLLRDFLIDDLKCPEAAVFQVPQGVDVKLFSESIPKATLANLRKSLGIGDKKVVAYSAHLNIASDLIPVLLAWSSIYKDVPEHILLIIGGGPMEERFRQFAQRLGLNDVVIFTGNIEHAQVRTYFALAEIALVYLAPRTLANQYRSPLKIREYLASGLKIVCNELGELKKFEDVTYQSASNYEDFARKIREILRDGGDKREVIGQQQMIDSGDWEYIVDTFFTEYFPGFLVAEQ